MRSRVGFKRIPWYCVPRHQWVRNFSALHSEVGERGGFFHCIKGGKSDILASPFKISAYRSYKGCAICLNNSKPCSSPLWEDFPARMSSKLKPATISHSQ
ncbi:MAG: hypothetical protein Ct9H300mP9_3780 [Candidatus Neomarinimicrobiota bacterium]|nr:MAG: hypothetical protein Ct9H300mP9_3780 [Candidatus Neomarinimicrobiota bacterium]